VRFGGAVVADTRRALIARETHHETLYFVPIEDVRRDCLEPSALRTHCPFKGDACYWSLRTRQAFAEDAAWSLDDPYDQVAALRRHVAFLWDRVEGFWLDGERIEKAL
jgi:uncharacterized protein (DUF427 family)